MGGSNPGNAEESKSDGVDSFDIGKRAESAGTPLSGFAQALSRSSSKGASSTRGSTDMVSEPPSLNNDEFSPTSR